MEPVTRLLPVPFKDGYPTVDDRTATEFSNRKPSPRIKLTKPAELALVRTWSNVNSISLVQPPNS